jgi:hypothetical protein
MFSRTPYSSCYRPARKTFFFGAMVHTSARPSTEQSNIGFQPVWGRSDPVPVNVPGSQEFRPSRRPPAVDPNTACATLRGWRRRCGPVDTLIWPMLARPERPTERSPGLSQPTLLVASAVSRPEIAAICRRARKAFTTRSAERDSTSICSYEPPPDHGRSAAGAMHGVDPCAGGRGRSRTESTHSRAYR